MFAVLILKSIFYFDNFSDMIVSLLLYFDLGALGLHKRCFDFS